MKTRKIIVICFAIIMVFLNCTNNVVITNAENEKYDSEVFEVSGNSVIETNSLGDEYISETGEADEADEIIDAQGSNRNNDEILSSASASNDEVSQRLTELKSVLDGKYWNAGITPSLENNSSKWGLNTSASAGSASNTFAGGNTCNGFAYWLATYLFEGNPNPRKSASWSSVTNPGNNFNPTPGDVISFGASVHTAVVWKVSGDNIQVVETWGSGKNTRIHYGICSFTKNGTKYTLDSINKMSGMITTWRKHPTNINLVGVPNNSSGGESGQSDPVPQEPVVEISYPNPSVGTIVISYNSRGEAQYSADIGVGSGLSSAQMTLASNSGVTKYYTIPVANGKVSGTLPTYDFTGEAFNAIFTVTISVTDSTGRVSSNSVVVDQTLSVYINAKTVNLKVGESFQFVGTAKTNNQITQEKWYKYIREVPSAGLKNGAISQN